MMGFREQEFTTISAELCLYLVRLETQYMYSCNYGYIYIHIFICVCVCICIHTVRLMQVCMPVHDMKASYELGHPGYM